MSVQAATATLPAARVPTRWTSTVSTPNGAEGSQWEAVSGYGGEKRYFGTAFVIDEVATSVAGETTVPIWWISGSSTEATGPSCVTLPIRTPTMTMTMTTPSHGPKPYPSSSVEGICGYGNT